MASISNSDSSAVVRIAKPAFVRFFSIRSMVSTAAAMLLAVALATVAAGGTYAMWNQSAPIDSNATIRSGTAALTVTSALSMPNTPLYPGISVQAPVTVQNSGNVPVLLRLKSLVPPTATTMLSQSLVFGLAIAPTTAACSAGTVAPNWTGTFASYTPASFGTAIAVGSTAVLCVSVSLPITAPNGGQNQTATNFGGIIDAVQV